MHVARNLFPSPAGSADAAALSCKTARAPSTSRSSGEQPRRAPLHCRQTRRAIATTRRRSCQHAQCQVLPTHLCIRGVLARGVLLVFEGLFLLVVFEIFFLLAHWASF